MQGETIAKVRCEGRQDKLEVANAGQPKLGLPEYGLQRRWDCQWPNSATILHSSAQPFKEERVFQIEPAIELWDTVECGKRSTAERDDGGGAVGQAVAARGRAEGSSSEEWGQIQTRGDGSYKGLVYQVNARPRQVIRCHTRHSRDHYSIDDGLARTCQASAREEVECEGVPWLSWRTILGWSDLVNCLIV